ncbi:MAG: DUF3386 family protein [Planctomycetota bacterium]
MTGKRLLFLTMGLCLLAAPCFAAEDQLVAKKNSTPKITAQEWMQAAHDARLVWEEFPGFTADITIQTDADVATGKLEATSDFDYELTFETGEAAEWVDAKLRSVIGHRKPGRVAKGVTFAENVTSEDFGVFVTDGRGTFRIENGVIREVHRKSDSMWLEITNVELFDAGNGKVLPQTTAVTYRDPKTGDILKQRTNHFDWTKIGGIQLPKSCFTIETKAGGERETRKMTLVNHRLSEPEVSMEFTSSSKLHRPLPESLTSFGAAVVGEYLYVFSGHSGDAHGFGKDLLVEHFRRIKFDDPEAEWEELAMHKSAQSTALVTDGEYIYRVGGLSFLNSGEEETNFNSTDHFARYDIESNTWTELTKLPEPRSSLDAAVLGRSVYVAGGWNLQGASSREAPWHEDMLRFDLDQPEAGWQTVPGPGYLTRAASLAAHDGKIYLFGGIQQRGITRKVSVYDPKTETWTEGPELRPDSRAAGFATSSFAVGGKLFVSGASGVVYRLADDGSAWDVQDRLVYPRMFHRLLPVGEDRLIALGGTGSGGSGRMAVVESLNVSSDLSNAGKLVKWSVPYEGRAKHSQSLVPVGNKLYAFGGNASWKPHDFRAESFVDEAFCFDVAKRSVEKLPKMPKALQNAMAVSHDKNSEHSTIVLAGGLGIGEDETFGALANVFEFDPETDSWMTSQSLPSARGMASAVSHDEAIWMFGGSGKTHGLKSSILHWWGDDSAIGSLPNVEVPNSRRSFGGAVIGNEYFMVGGLGGGVSIEESTDVFDFETREWRSAASPMISRVFPTTCVADGKLYLFGGFSNEGGHFEESPSLECYDPETNKWTMLAHEIPGIDASMRLINMRGRLLFFGIDRDREGYANFVLFDPAPTAEPTEVAGMSFARRSGGGDAERNAKMLMRRDTDKDGKLSAAELGSRMAKFVERADSDGDQLVSFIEAKTVMEADEKEAAASADAAADDDQESETTDEKTQAESNETEVTAEQAQAAADAAQREADAAQRAADAAQRKADKAQRLADSLTK